MCLNRTSVKGFVLLTFRFPMQISFMPLNTRRKLLCCLIWSEQAFSISEKQKQNTITENVYTVKLLLLKSL